VANFLLAWSASESQNPQSAEASPKGNEWTLQPESPFFMYHSHHLVLCRSKRHVNSSTARYAVANIKPSLSGYLRIYQSSSSQSP
jgi:hypothetical protein